MVFSIFRLATEYWNSGDCTSPATHALLLYLSTRHRVLKLMPYQRLHETTVLLYLSTRHRVLKPDDYGRKDFREELLYLSTRHRVLKLECINPHLNYDFWLLYLSTRHRVLKPVSRQWGLQNEHASLSFDSPQSTETDTVFCENDFFDASLSFDSPQSTETLCAYLDSVAKLTFSIFRLATEYWNLTGNLSYVAVQNLLYLSTRHRVLKLSDTLGDGNNENFSIFRLATEYWNRGVLLGPWLTDLFSIFRLATEYWNIQERNFNGVSHPHFSIFRLASEYWNYDVNTWLYKWFGFSIFRLASEYWNFL